MDVDIDRIVALYNAYWQFIYHSYLSDESTPAHLVSMGQSLGPDDWVRTRVLSLKIYIQLPHIY